MGQKKDKKQSFEEALEELESLVSRMEKGELSLEESLKQYERGVELTRACEDALDKARQRIEELSAADDDANDADNESEDTPD